MNARARTTAGEATPPTAGERARRILAAYADYQLKTEREIPVVVLDPVH